MELTGKAKESFIDYLDKTNQIKIEKGILNLHWQDLPEKFKNALIIEWFDSVGIYITFDYLDLNKCFYSEISNYNSFSIVGNRQECAKNSILKANEIYNEKK